MISKRNYFNIVLIILVVFFMFVGTIWTQDSFSDYTLNRYLSDPVFSRTDVFVPSEDDGVIAFIGSQASPVYHTVETYASYTKRNLSVYSSANDVPDDETAGFMIVDGENIHDGIEINALRRLRDEGRNIVFASLPSVESIQAMPALQQLLGISEIRGTAHCTGVHLFGGFLLGGEAIYRADSEEEEEYQDFDLDMPWFITLEGTKTYMVGLMEDSDEKNQNEYLPAMIWRASQGSGMVFAVYGGYMRSIQYGLGLLSAFEYEAEDYVLYPVVNAQNLIVENFPEMSDENEDVMRQVYGRSQTSFESEVILPMISAELQNTGFRMSAFLTTENDASDAHSPKAGMLDAWLRELRKNDSELGISLMHSSGSLGEKAEETNTYFQNETDTYQVSALLMNENDIDEAGTLTGAGSTYDHINTVVTDSADDSLFSYLTDSILLERETSSAASHTYRDDLKLKCLETALAYSNVVMDITQVLWPEEESDQWQKYAEKAFSNLTTWWKPYENFGHTTISESDQRIRQMLALDYDVQSEQDQIQLHTAGLDTETSYILRLHNREIDHMGGGNYVEIEEGSYLVTVKGADCVIYLKDAGNTHVNTGKEAS